MGISRPRSIQCVVLIVEDNIETYDLYSEILASAGYAVIAADNGEDAIAKATEQRPDLIIMDYDLVGMDGVEATHRLKEDSRTHDIPILMMTGHVGRAHVEHAKTSGCDAFLPKPCSLDRLLEEVSHHVSPSAENRPTVLLVEDDDDIRASLAQVLEGEGFGVVGAANGREALHYLGEARTPPKLIVLDLMMPVMDGWHFRQAQLADERFADIPVVILSAVTEHGDKVASLDASAFLPKPVDLPALLSVIDRHAH